MVPRHHYVDDGPSAPEATIAQLTACVERGVSGLSESSYAIRFDVNASAGGGVQSAQVKDSTFVEGSIESCLKHALQAMSLPRSITARRSKEPVSPQSRGSMGNVWVLVGAVNLAPIFIVAAGVTVVVAVAVYVLSETTTATRDATDDAAEKERCKKVKQECINYCSDTALPTGDFGWKFRNCKHECIERHGCPRDS